MNIINSRQLTGQVSWKAQYKVYGNVARYEVQEFENNIRFPSQYYDTEAGLH